MDRTKTLRRVALWGVGVVATSWLVACTSPPATQTPAPVPAPSASASAPAAVVVPPPPPPPEPVPATPAAAQQAQRLAIAAVELLELGSEEQALAEIQHALQVDPANRLAQSLLKQIQTDPQQLLGREHFSYRVEPGESLSRIAGRFLKDVHLFYALARYNDIKVPRQLQGGQQIKVPGKAPPPPPPAATPAAAPAPATPTPSTPSTPSNATAPVPPPPPAAPPPRAAPEATVAQDYRRGLALLAQQRPAEAIVAFDKVLEREPQHAHARLKRAQALSQVSGLIRLLDNTIKRLDAQIAREPDNAAARAERDKAMADRQRLQQVK